MVKKIMDKAVFQILFFLGVSFLQFVILELYFGKNFFDFSPEIIGKNVLLIIAVNLVLVGIFHNIRIPMIISGVFFMIVGIANYFVMKFRGYGIVFMDFYAVKTAATVAGGYSYAVNLKFVAAVISQCILIGISCFLPKRKHKYFHARYMLISLLGVVTSVFFFLWINVDAFFFQGVSDLTWDHNIGIQEYGYILYFVSNAGKATVEKPDQYSKEKVEKLLSKYKEEKDDNSKKQNPNLIMIMNESFSDVNILGTVMTNQEVMPFYKHLNKNVIKGYAQSSVYGGYTANSEFEFLTGCSKAFLPGNPYLQYVDDYIPSLITTLKEQNGYKDVIAMHPYHSSGYNRNRVYPLLGFDQFISIDDFSKKNLVRDYVGDEEDYQKIIELYEKKKKGQPLCVFNVTMQNHNPYDDDKYQFRNPIKVTNFEAMRSTNQYLSLMRMSDDALEKLVTYFEKADEPTMIVLFGDHQPHLADSFYQKVLGKTPDLLTQDQVMKEHTVPFMIWTNYDIPAANADKISLNYLSSLMLKTAGLNMSPFQRYLLDLHKKIPSISATGYYDKKGCLHNFTDRDRDNQRLIHEYEMIQYNYLFDAKNRLDTYFEPASD